MTYIGIEKRPKQDHISLQFLENFIPQALLTMTDDARLHYPSTARNRDVILPVLKDLLRDEGTILEIGSGSGEHTVYFAPHFPNATWQPTDIDPDGLKSIEAWTAHSGAINIKPPVNFTSTAADWPFEPLSAILCINMIHISPWDSCVGLMRGAGATLDAGGLVYLYGPFKIDGKHTSESNVEFEGWLKERDPANGVRDLADVTAEAEKNGLTFETKIPMPANNFSVVFRKT